MDFSVEALWGTMGLVAKIVIITLILMSVASVYVAIERSITFWKARRQSTHLAAAISEPLGREDVKAANDITREKEYRFSYLGHLVSAGLGELSARFDRPGQAAAARAMERAAVQETLDLKKGTGILATVGATAPFVGLVGTVFGIINAFEGMAESGSGGLASVSAGIAEALVATGVGIAVAIIGVWLFNYYNSRIEVITSEMTISIQEFLDWVEKVLLEREENPVAKEDDDATEQAPTTPTGTA